MKTWKLHVIQYQGETLGENYRNLRVEVTETEPGIKGDTSGGGSKTATLETGLVVTVPLFINVGDKLIINTDEGSYVSRA